MTLLHRKKAWLSFQFYKLHVGEIRHTEAVDVDGETTPVFSWCLGANINGLVQIIVCPRLCRLLSKYVCTKHVYETPFLESLCPCVCTFMYRCAPAR